MTPHHQERTALQVSTIGTGGLALLGIGFCLFVNSDSILLDAFYNVISFVMSLGTLWIAWLVRQPESQVFQFGYMGFVPLTNILKGLLVTIVSLFAGMSSIQGLVSGGRATNSTLAMIYAAIAATSCLLITLYQWRVSQKINSPLLRVDTKNWLVNGLISLSVGLAFAIASWIENTSLAWFVPYTDPTLTLLIVTLSLPIPLKTIGSNLYQLLWGAPTSERQLQIKHGFDQAIAQLPYEHIWLRTAEIGDFIYIHAYWLLSESQQSLTLADLDQMRLSIIQALQALIPNLEADIIFTQDAEHASSLDKNACFIWTAAKPDGTSPAALET